jgi:diguanylate cyclase (GGDEF)-like protein
MLQRVKEWCRNVIHNCIYGKVNKNFYYFNKNLLDQINYVTIRRAYLFTSILFICLLVFLLSSGRFENLIDIYIKITTFFTVIAVCLFTVLKKSYRYSRALYYVFSASVFALAIMVGTVMNTDKPAVCFFVLLVIVPVIYVDKPVYSVLMSALACAAFSIAAIKMKSAYPDIVSLDLINVVECFPISAVFVVYIRNMYLQYMQATIIFQEKSETDRLTGISNKACTDDLCNLYLKSKKGITDSALLVIDLDNFKCINDTLGHRQGDEFLNRAGNLLKEIFREKDVIGRIGGDEFLVLMKDVSDVELISRKAILIGRKIQSIYSHLTVTQFTCSIGISLSTKEEPLEYHAMFCRADRALYAAKKKGKNQYSFYEEASAEAENKPFMLIADDNEASRAVLCSCFEDEYEIYQAEDGVQALANIEKHKEVLSVFLLDMEMPIMNGYDVLKSVQKDKFMEQIPILAIAEEGTNDLTFLESGAADLITKPFDPSIVRKQVDDARRLFKAVSKL